MSLRWQLGYLPLVESKYSQSNNRPKCCALLVLPSQTDCIQLLIHTSSGMPEMLLKLFFISLAFQKPIVDFDQLVILSFWSSWSSSWGATLDPTLIFPGGYLVVPRPKIEPGVFFIDDLWCHLYHELNSHMHLDPFPDLWFSLTCLLL